MNSSVQRPSILVIAAVAAFLVPRPASAFSRSRALVATEQSDSEGYEQLALSSLRDRQSWPYVARMLEKSASLRKTCDVRAIRALVLAGRIYHHLGQLEMARLTFVQAADRAVAVGALEHAAHYYDAGNIAVARDGREAAVEPENAR